jgi:predicted NACHT family NTPase
MDKGRVLEFLSKDVLKLESNLEKLLFKKCFEGNETNKLVVMVDGFDEISPKYKQTVLDMLQVLKQTSLEQLWVTTRPYLRQELEDALQQLSYTLQPFSEDEQVEFLKKFWLQHLDSEDMGQARLKIYAEVLIRKLAQSINDKEKEFTGIPLQTRMLAEAFEKQFRKLYESEKSEPELQHKLDLLGLYRGFIDRKYDIYYTEKSKTPAGKMAAEEHRECDLKYIKVEHQRLALKTLFTEDKIAFLQNDHHSSFSDEELGRIGIVQKNNEGELQFIHRTIAEYFVAEFLINQLTKKIEQHDLLLNIVLLEKDYQVTRLF